MSNLRFARLAAKTILPMLTLGGLAWLSLAPRIHAATADGEKAGTVEKIKVHGASLEGNLEGDTADRDVFVYLPPSYATQPGRRYPVVYFIHGYGATAEAYWKMMTVPDTANKLMNAGTVQEMILVHPDAHTIYDGSMYSNSPTTGNWEAYITSDLVSYIDSHYRTIASSDSRGLAGHSMGGYGVVRLAMKYPHVFSSIYAMSSCCLMNNPGAGRGAPAPATQAVTPAPQAAPAATPPAPTPGRAGRGGGFANVVFAESAAWSPNPMNPPKYYDLPTQDGVVHPEIVAKWIANSPLAMVDQYVPNLKTYRAFAMDVGDADTLAGSNKQLDQSLTRLGVPHTFQVYEGNHTNHVKDQFEAKVLPFFSANLKVSGGDTKK